MVVCLFQPSSGFTMYTNNTISEKVFQAISDAFGGNESSAGIMHRYYRAIGMPRYTFMQNLNVETGKTPTVSRFLDSCNRLLCNRCFRYDCLEHPYRANNTPKIYPIAAPNEATSPCSDDCHLTASKAEISAGLHKPLTLADKAILKTFMTEGEEDNYTYCQLAFFVDRPCRTTFVAIKELLQSPEEAEPGELSGKVHCRFFVHFLFSPSHFFCFRAISV